MSEQKNSDPPPRILTIAGSDSGGGAGIQADIKTITVLGGYAMSAVTAVTVQDTLRVRDIVPIPAAAVGAQIAATLDDIGADAIKTGMLGDTRLIEQVAGILDDKARELPVVVDPVMVASSGDALLPPEAVDAVRSLMLPNRVVTPNAPEAARLAGHDVDRPDDLRRAAERILKAGARAALVKGAHLPGDVICDVLATHDGEHIFQSPRIGGAAKHGTGCTLASAMATWMGRGLDEKESSERALAWLAEVLCQSPELGRGHHPLHHGWASPPSEPAGGPIKKG